MARPITTSLSKSMDLAFDDPLSAEEKESNLIAIAALLYQRGGQLDATWLVAFSLLGICGPRLAKYLADKKRQDKLQTPGNEAKREALKAVTPTAPEKVG